MNIQTGIDLVETGRIQKSLQNPRFLTRVFSKDERDLFARMRDAVPTIAANFAAKEAFSKAMGTGVRGFLLAEVSVLRNELGAPYLALSGQAQKLAEGLCFSVSLTHTEHYASAVVVAYSDD